MRPLAQRCWICASRYRQAAQIRHHACALTHGRAMRCRLMARLPRRLSPQHWSLASGWSRFHRTADTCHSAPPGCPTRSVGRGGREGNRTGRVNSLTISVACLAVSLCWLRLLRQACRCNAAHASAQTCIAWCTGIGRAHCCTCLVEPAAVRRRHVDLVLGNCCSKAGAGGGGGD